MWKPSLMLKNRMSATATNLTLLMPYSHLMSKELQNCRVLLIAMQPLDERHLIQQDMNDFDILPHCL